MKCLSTCAFCGNQQETFSLLSSNTDGHYDLDLRPPEMLRSSMRYWVQECEHCGYCATDISEEIPDEMRSLIEPIINLLGFECNRKNKNLPDLANRFCHQGSILSHIGDHEQAGWAFLHAAWDCDDERPGEIGAIECRKYAYDSFVKCKMKGIQFATPEGYEEEIMVDILRRSGAFEKANSLCFEAYTHISTIEDAYLLKVLEFQRDLIWMENTECYNFGQVLDKKN